MTTQINQLTELTSTSDGDLLLIRENATGVDKKMQASNLRAKATTKDDVGLGDVDNVSAANLRDRSTHTGTQPLSTISDSGTMASQDANSVNIDGGTIDGTAVNATTLTASGDVNFDSGTMFVDASLGKVEVSRLEVTTDQTTLPFQISQISPISSSDVNGGRGVFLSTAGNSTNNTGQILNAIGFSGQGTGRRRAMIANLQSGGTTTGGHIAFYTNGSAGSNDSVIERMRIESSGKITATTGGGWVGTVSQSGQSSVIERGSNANGEFVRYADGTQICTNMNTPFNPPIDGVLTCPVSFVGSSHGWATNFGPGSAWSTNWFVVVKNNSAQNRTTIQYETRLGTANSLVKATVIGRWF